MRLQSGDRTHLAESCQTFGRVMSREIWRKVLQQKSPSHAVTAWCNCNCKETAHIWQSHVKSDLEKSAPAEKCKPGSGAIARVETTHIWQSHVKSDLEKSATAEKSKPCSAQGAIARNTFRAATGKYKAPSAWETSLHGYFEQFEQAERPLKEKKLKRY